MASIISNDRQWAMPAALACAERGVVGDYAEALVSVSRRAERRLAPNATAFQGTDVSIAFRPAVLQPTAFLPTAFSAAPAAVRASDPAAIRLHDKSIESLALGSIVELEPRDRRSGAGTGVKGGVPPRGRPDSTG